MSPLAFSRREMLARTGTGFGLLGLAGVLAPELRAADAPAANPLAAKKPHFPARAKQIAGRNT